MNQIGGEGEGTTASQDATPDDEVSENGEAEKKEEEEGEGGEAGGDPALAAAAGEKKPGFLEKAKVSCR